MIKVAMEISDNTAQYNHFISLADAVYFNDEFDLTLFCTSEDTKSKFLQYVKDYDFESFSEMEVEVLNSDWLTDIKKYVIKVLKLLKINFFISKARTVYSLVSKKTSVEPDIFKKNSVFFMGFHVVCTTELRDSRFLRDNNIKLVWLLHGLLSNPTVFNKNWGCDLVVSPDKKLSDSKLLEKLSSKPLAVYNEVYLKYNSIQHLKVINQSLFDNNNHTFFYNPHWDSAQSEASWFSHGEKILDFFKNNTKYNLIFAPHINLHKFYDISFTKKYSKCINIHIDIDSIALTNGLYFHMIDTYIGDVSSQFFEIVGLKSVTAIFLDFHDNYKNNSEVLNYWKDGVVCKNFADFGGLISQLANHQYLPIDGTKYFEPLTQNGLDGLCDKLQII